MSSGTTHLSLVGATVAALSMLAIVAPVSLGHGDRTGYVTTRIGPQLSTASSVSFQGRKIVAGGGAYTPYTIRHYSRFLGFALARYTASGTLDRSFGRNGTVLTPIGKQSGAESIAVESNGDIVVAGWAVPQLRNGLGPGDFALARYTRDGHLDPNFGDAGVVTTDLGGDDAGKEVALEPGGKVLVAGSSGGRFAAARYNANGTLDRGFGSGGTVRIRPGRNCSIYDLAVDPHGAFKLAGSCAKAGSNHERDRLVVAAFNADGSRDRTFGRNGVAGHRLMPPGRRPSSTSCLTYSIDFQPRGRLVASCQSNVYTRRRLVVKTRVDEFNADLSPRRRFGDRGAVLLNWRFFPARTVTLTDGDLLLAGEKELAHGGGRTHFAMVRLMPSGKHDRRFGHAGFATANVGGPHHGDQAGGNDQGIYAMAFPSRRRLIAAGSGGREPTSFAVARFHLASGSLDRTFGRR